MKKRKYELNYAVRIWISFSTKALVKTSLSINSSNLAKMKIWSAFLIRSDTLSCGLRLFLSAPTFCSYENKEHKGSCRTIAKHCSLCWYFALVLAEGAKSLFALLSAGVGRTGSFIAIDSLMEQMDTEKVVDVYGFVAQMRKQRNYMVQTEVSYNSFGEELLYLLSISSLMLKWRPVVIPL